MSRYALPIAACTEDLAARVGGKALGLGRLVRIGREVPPGFVVTTDAYHHWIEEHGVADELGRLLQAAAGGGTPEAASRGVQALFEGAGLGADLVAEVGAAYSLLGDGADTPVAVRSSATAEDLADASFAGQQDTYLGVMGLEAVLSDLVRCWASLFSPRAISYRHRLGVPANQTAMAVVVQRMVAAEVSGVMLTVDPVTGDPSQVTIECAFGLGLPVVGGELNPDHYAVDKVSLEIRSRAAALKPFADRLEPATGTVRRVPLPEAEAGAYCLRDLEVVRLAETGKEIERALGGPADVEWAMGPGPEGPRHLYLLQARPETVWSRRTSPPVAPANTSALDRMVSMMAGGTKSQRERRRG